MVDLPTEEHAAAFRKPMPLRSMLVPPVSSGATRTTGGLPQLLLPIYLHWQ